MNCERTTALLVDRWTGRLGQTEEEELQAHLRKCGACRSEATELSALWERLGGLPEEEPGPRLAARFRVMLEAYREGREARRSWLQNLDVWFGRWLPQRPALQAALGVLLLATGLWVGRSLGPAERHEIAELSEQVHHLRTLVAVSLLQQPSAGDRLRGVSWSYQLSDPDGDVVEALVEALNRDPNVNVRLAAVDALSRFADREAVRRELLLSLSRANSPLVQIALIDLMVERREREAMPVLQRMAADAGLLREVRDRARRGLQQMGKEG